MQFKTIKNRNFKDKKVLLRVDFNVPVENNKIIDDFRIKAHLPTIKYLINQGAKVILISHLGRPKRKEKKFSLKPIAEYLKKILKRNIEFIDDCLGKKVEEKIKKMKAKEVILLENLRFYPGEKKNDQKFAKQLSSLADVYVNDAFSVSHRRHSSVSAIAKFLPSYAGLLLEKEINRLLSFLTKAKHPKIVLLGGAKISTKIGLIKNLVKVSDKILIGGALANNFFYDQGLVIGNSLVEKDIKLDQGKWRKKIVLPVDVKIKIQEKKSKIRKVKIENLINFKNKKFKILDLGEESIKLFSNYLKRAGQIIWNGPVGYFEDKKFAQGTLKLAKEIFKNKKAEIIIGGGETISALKMAVPVSKLISKKNILISTGGGAMLEFLEGKKLPGIEALIKKK